MYVSKIVLLHLVLPTCMNSLHHYTPVEVSVDSLIFCVETICLSLVILAFPEYEYIQFKMKIALWSCQLYYMFP